jgi:hypothetical protein
MPQPDNQSPDCSKNSQDYSQAGIINHSQVEIIIIQDYRDSGDSDPILIPSSPSESNDFVIYSQMNLPENVLPFHFFYE